MAVLGLWRVAAYVIGRAGLTFCRPGTPMSMEAHKNAPNAETCPSVMNSRPGEGGGGGGLGCN